MVVIPICCNISKQLYVLFCFVIFYFFILVFYCFVLCQTNAQLFYKLSHSYIFRRYRVILRELVINTLPSYTNISNAAVGNTIYN